MTTAGYGEPDTGAIAGGVWAKQDKMEDGTCAVLGVVKPIRQRRRRAGQTIFDGHIALCSCP